MTTSKGRVRKVKGWAIVSNGGVLIGGGDKNYGYTPLHVFSTRVGALAGISPTRPTDKVVPCEISLPITRYRKKK